MSESFDCKICDKSIKIKSKKKHLRSQQHYFFDKNIVDRYCVKNSDFTQIENILQKHFLEYNKNI